LCRVATSTECLRRIISRRIESLRRITYSKCLSCVTSPRIKGLRRVPPRAKSLRRVSRRIKCLFLVNNPLSLRLLLVGDSTLRKVRLCVVCVRCVREEEKQRDKMRRATLGHKRMSVYACVAPQSSEPWLSDFVMPPAWGYACVASMPPTTASAISSSSVVSASCVRVRLMRGEGRGRGKVCERLTRFECKGKETNLCFRFGNPRIKRLGSVTSAKCLRRIAGRVGCLRLVTISSIRLRVYEGKTSLFVCHHPRLFCRLVSLFICLSTRLSVHALCFPHVFASQQWSRTHVCMCFMFPRMCCMFPHTCVASMDARPVGAGIEENCLDCIASSVGSLIASSSAS
jgi:hypothetical protein